MNIFVNCANGEGVMIFAESEEMTIELAQKWCDACNLNVADICKVKDEDVQYYCYDPVWVDGAKLERIKKLIANHQN